MQYPLRAHFIYDYKKKKKKSSISFVLRIVHLPDVFSFVHHFMYSITLEVAWSLTSHLHTEVVLSEVFSFNPSKSPIFFLLPGTQCFMYCHCSWQVYPFSCALRRGQFNFFTLPYKYLLYIRLATILANIWVQIVCMNVLLIRTYPLRHLKVFSD